MAFFTDLGRFPKRPEILHIILPCSRSRWEESGCETTCYVLQKRQYIRGQQLIHPSIIVLPWHVNRRSSCHLPHNRASLISVRKFVGGGGVNCMAKAQVLVTLPLFFLEVGRKKGGVTGAVQYTSGILTNQPVLHTCFLNFHSMVTYE